MTDENQMQDYIENVVKKLNAARLNEITTTFTKTESEKQPEPELPEIEETGDILKSESSADSIVKEQVVEQANTETLSGQLKVIVKPPVTYLQMKKLQELLKKIEGLRIKSVGGSSGEGQNMIILVEQPIPLLERLVRIDLVQKATRKAKVIEIILKTK